MWWATVPAAPAEDSVAKDMAAMGVQGFAPPAWMTEEAQAEDCDFDVLPENFEAAIVFLACSTQWQRNEKGRLVGIRYEALRIVLELHKVADPSDVFGRVQVMESAALKEFRRQAANEEG